MKSIIFYNFYRIVILYIFLITNQIVIHTNIHTYRYRHSNRHITYKSMTGERLQALARDRVPHLQSLVN